jgi:hypothetical protein
MSSHFIDANLLHERAMGRSVTGFLHLNNKIPMEWHSKKQATVKKGTYRSDNVAASICV